MKTSPKSSALASSEPLLSRIELEAQQVRDLSQSPIGTDVEVYFPTDEEVGVFSVIEMPGRFRDGLYCITRNRAGDKFFFRPLTSEMYGKNRNGKVFAFLRLEGENAQPESAQVQRRTTSKLWRVLGPVAIAGGVLLSAALLTGKKSEPEKEQNIPVSFANHYSLSHPIPGVTLYDSIAVRGGQNLEQLSGEYLISMKYLYDLNPDLTGKVIDGVINEDMSLIVPKAREIFHLQEPLSWNQIGEIYGIDPFILMKINGADVKIGDIVMIPTEAQARDILQYLGGEDIESVLYQLKETASLEEIALYMKVPEHLHELFYEMNLSSDDDKSPAAIHSKTQKLQAGARFIIPTIRDFSPELLGNIHKQHRAYDIHRAGQNESLESIAVYYGIPLDAIQKLNPQLKPDQVLAAGTQVKTRDTSHIIREVSAQVVLPKSVIAFVAEMEIGGKKEGYIRPGLTQMTKKEVSVTTKVKGKKKTVTQKIEVYKFPNDCITLEPGCDLGQIDEAILRYALDTIVEPEMIERIVLLSKKAKEFRKTKDKDGKLPTHALKEIPADFHDVASLKLTEKQTSAMKVRIMQAYWDTYLKKHVPNIDKPGFVSDQIKAALMSIIYHRGGYFFSKTELQLMQEGKWDDAIILDAIKRGKKGTESRTEAEVEMFKAGLGLLHHKG